MPVLNRTRRISRPSEMSSLKEGEVNSVNGDYELPPCPPGCPLPGEPRVSPTGSPKPSQVLVWLLTHPYRVRCFSHETSRDCQETKIRWSEESSPPHHHHFGNSHMPRGVRKSSPLTCTVSNWKSIFQTQSDVDTPSHVRTRPHTHATGTHQTCVLPTPARTPTAFLLPRIHLLTFQCSTSLESDFFPHPGRTFYCKPAGSAGPARGHKKP